MSKENDNHHMNFGNVVHIKTDEQRNDDVDQLVDNNDDESEQSNNSTKNRSNNIMNENENTTRSNQIRRDDDTNCNNPPTVINENEELLLDDDENDDFIDYKSDIESLLEHIFVIGNEKRFWYGRVKKAGSDKKPFLFYNPNNNNKKIKTTCQNSEQNSTTTSISAEQQQPDDSKNSSTIVKNTNHDIIWIREYVMEQLQLYQKDQKYINHNSNSNNNNTKRYMKSLALMITNCIIRARSILCNNEKNNSVLNHLQRIESIEEEDTKTKHTINVNISLQIKSFFIEYSQNILNMEKQKKLTSTIGISSSQQQQDEVEVKGDDDNRRCLDDKDDVELEEIEILIKQEKSIDHEKSLEQQEKNLKQQQPMIISNYDELFVDVQTKALIHVYRRIILEKSQRKVNVDADKKNDNKGTAINHNTFNNLDNNYLMNDQKYNPLNEQQHKKRKVLIHSSDIGLYEESVNIGFEQLPWPIPRKRKNMFGDGYRYHHTYTDDIDMNINPITFSKYYLSLLPSQQQKNDNKSLYSNNINDNVRKCKIQYSDINPEKEQVNDDPHFIEKLNPNRGLLLHCWQRAIHAASSSINVSVSSSSSKTTTTPIDPSSYNTDRSNPSSLDDEKNLKLPSHMAFISHYDNRKRDVSYSQLICQRLGLTLHSLFQNDEKDTDETEQSSSNKNVDNENDIQNHYNDDDSSVIIISEKKQKTQSRSLKQNTEEDNDENPFSDTPTMKLEQYVKEITTNRQYACPVCTVEFNTQSKLHHHYYGMNQTNDYTSTAENDSNDISATNSIVGCCWTLIERTRCKNIEDLLQREVDVQLKQLLQLIFVNTLVTQNENNQEDCNQSISNSTTQSMKKSKKKSSSSSTTQNISNSPKNLYNWKHVISMLERALHESKVSGLTNENNKSINNDNDMNDEECVNNKKTTTDQQRHPLFETLSFFSDESPIVLNPMILQTIKNRLVDRYCTVPR